MILQTASPRGRSIRQTDRDTPLLFVFPTPVSLLCVQPIWVCSMGITLQG